MSVGAERIARRARRLVASCLLEEGILIGSLDDIMGHHLFPMALFTFRECNSAIEYILENRMSLTKQNIRLIANSHTQSRLEYLDEIVDLCLNNTLARMFWRSRVPDPELYPHRCPDCLGAAFIGIVSIDCRSRCDLEEHPDA